MADRYDHGPIHPTLFRDVIFKDVLMETDIRRTMPWDIIRDTLKKRYRRGRKLVGQETKRSREC
jgi:hypothetical protein